MSNRRSWFVGASDSENGDQTPRFLEESIWENGYTDKYIDLVNSIQVGDKIAIKSAYTRKRDLPFDTRGNVVSVMGIKAIGTVTKNYNDGRKIDVNWTKLDKVKEWYFFTGRNTIWKVERNSDNWMYDALIDFTFSDKPQDTTRFRNEPFWRDRFGDKEVVSKQYAWSKFYEAFATSLLRYQEKRSALITGIYSILDQLEINSGFLTENGKRLTDICPFTVMGVFNRGIKDSSRIAILKKFADLLNISEKVPYSFDGIPMLNNMQSWFFSNSTVRKTNDINNLWKLFSTALKYAENGEDAVKEMYIQEFDEVIKQDCVKWNITFGCFWIRPWEFLPLDKQTRCYLKDKLNIDFKTNSPKGTCTGKEYFEIIDIMKMNFAKEEYPVHSFPELSVMAYKKAKAYEGDEITLYKDEIVAVLNLLGGEAHLSNIQEEIEKRNILGAIHTNLTWQATVKATLQRFSSDSSSFSQGEDLFYTKSLGRSIWGLREVVKKKENESYSKEQFLSKVYIGSPKYEAIVALLKRKKNIIIQGPPGVGKSFLAKRLAFSLLKEKNESKVAMVQFHQSYSYEDFIFGYRPTEEGKFALKAGVFTEFCNKAIEDSDSDYYFIIDEINRGNLSKIMGELMLLIEGDKRGSNNKMRTVYSDEDFYIPENIYIIGMMNTADRSLALMDYALRRRFSFVKIEPAFDSEGFTKYLQEKNHEELNKVIKQVEALNVVIRNDSSLGAGFQIGHSYFCNLKEITDNDLEAIVECDIIPMLEEYWFDEEQLLGLWKTNLQGALK